MEQLAKEQKEQHLKTSHTNKRHKKEKEISDKEAMQSVVSTIDTEDGNELITSFIKGEDGSRRKHEDKEDDTEESNVQIWDLYS